MESTNRTEQQNSKVEVHGKVVARLVPPVSREEPAWRKPGLKLVTKAPPLNKAALHIKSHDGRIPRLGKGGVDAPTKKM